MCLAIVGSMQYCQRVVACGGFGGFGGFQGVVFKRFQFCLFMFVLSINQGTNKEKIQIVIETL